MINKKVLYICHNTINKFNYVKVNNHTYKKREIKNDYHSNVEKAFLNLLISLSQESFV